MLTFTSQLRYLRQAGWRLQVPRRGLRQGFRRLTNRRRPTPRQMGTCRLHERDPHHHEMGDLAVRSLPKSNTPSLIANPFFRAPYLVVLKDRGQALRFYRPYQIRLRDDALREFLKVDGWKVSNPWSTAYAPGGDRYVLRPHQIPRPTNLLVLYPLMLQGIHHGIHGRLVHQSIQLDHHRPQMDAPVRLWQYCVPPHRAPAW
jgi:hypothetical protein